MKSHAGFVLAVVLFDGAALAWALWEIWSVRPRRKIKDQETPGLSGPSPEEPRHPER